MKLVIGVDPGHHGVVLPLEIKVTQCVCDADQQLLRLEGFGQVVLRAQARNRGDGADRAFAGHHDGLNVQAVVLNGFENIQAADSRHL